MLPAGWDWVGRSAGASASSRWPECPHCGCPGGQLLLVAVICPNPHCEWGPQRHTGRCGAGEVVTAGDRINGVPRAIVLEWLDIHYPGYEHT